MPKEAAVSKESFSQQLFSMPRNTPTSHRSDMQGFWASKKDLGEVVDTASRPYTGQAVNLGLSVLRLYHGTGRIPIGTFPQDVVRWGQAQTAPAVP